MSKIPFKVSARAGKLLGRENFSNPEGAIIELVKNTYDADAKNCLVIFDIHSTKKQSAIYIIDNGEGMTEDVILNHWMKIGTGNKEKDYISDNKRIKTGAKGIGRFALDRLGFKTEMWTVPKNNYSKGYSWEMDWSQFDNDDKAISEIEADIKVNNQLNLDYQISNLIDNSEVGQIVKEFGCTSGTILKISNLKDDWQTGDKGNIQSVFKGLEALVPPKDLEITFNVYFYHLQQKEKYGKVETAYFNDYDYKINAKYDSKNLVLSVDITRNEFDEKLIEKDYPNVLKDRQYPYDLKTLIEKRYSYSKPIKEVLNWKYSENSKKILEKVGDFSISFYYLKFTNSNKEQYPYKLINAAERKSILDRFGGVKIYRDSFRVRPYGDNENDWLELGRRRVISPAGAGQRIGDWRVNPNSTAGIITISRKTNPYLIDKSDRSALQENDVFEMFKKIIIGIIHEFEYDRTKILNPFYIFNQEKKAREKEEEFNKKATELAEKIIQDRDNEDKRKRNKKNKKQEENKKESYEETFKEAFKAIDEGKYDKENKEIVQIRTLASLGLIVSSFSHELSTMSNDSSEIHTLAKNYLKLVPETSRKQFANEYNDSLNTIDILIENDKRIKHWVDYSLTAIRKDKRKREKLNFDQFYKQLKKSWIYIFHEYGITPKFSVRTFSKEYDFRAFEMDMITIFSNLIRNSIDSFERQIKINQRYIKIETELNKNTVVINYSDNGNGLDDIFSNKEDIFLPFTTSKKDSMGNDIGTGLGMYLVKEVVNDYAGSIDILNETDGFALKVTFPTRRLRDNG